MTPPSPYDGDTSPASLGRKARGFLVGLALAATSLAAGGLALDRIFPPDLSRYNDRSTEVVDSSGHLRTEPDRHGLECFFGAVFERQT